MNNCDGLVLVQNKASSFYVHVPDGILIRVNIKLFGVSDNMNHDSSGWNIFTTPDTPNVLGRGNSGIWAQFYLEKENDYYYIVSFHSVNIKNKNGGFGRYVGVDGDKIVCDLPKCDNARWYIK